jgi:hypothetical protein
LRETGATGREPATSGVTSHFEDRDMNDDRPQVAVFMRFLSFSARVEGDGRAKRASGVAARLLPERPLRLDSISFGQEVAYLLSDSGRVVEPRHVAGAFDEAQLSVRKHAGDPLPDVDGADWVRRAEDVERRIAD